MQSKTEKRIENVKDEIAKLNNKKNVLIQKHKAEERRARTHRLCKNYFLRNISKAPAIAFSPASSIVSGARVIVASSPLDAG